MKQRHLPVGFTLIELMIVVAIIGIIAMIAWPNYTRYVQNSRRTDAMVALNQIASMQEKYRSDCGLYAAQITTTRSLQSCGNRTSGDASTRVFGSTASPEGDYIITLSGGTISTSVCSAGDFNCGFIVTADPNGVGASGRMAGNGALRLDSTQRREWNKNGSGTWVPWSSK